jgi:hypothetical protein
MVFFLDLTASTMHEREMFLAFLKMPSLDLAISDKAFSVKVLCGSPALSSSFVINDSISSGVSVIYQNPSILFAELLVERFRAIF